MKRITLLIGLTFFLMAGCEFFDDVKEIDNAKNVKMTTESVKIEIATPATDSFDINNPLCTNKANYKFTFRYNVKADNSKNDEDAQIGKLDLGVIADTVGAEEIAVSGEGKKVYAASSTILNYVGYGDGEKNRIAIRYFIDKLVTTSKATVRANGTYTVTISGHDVNLSMPEQTADFTPDANVETRKYLKAALDAGLFD